MDRPTKWKGIQTNFCIFQGEVVEDPVENGGFHFIKLETKVVTRDANGQFTEIPQIIPLLVEPSGPVSAVAHIKTGRKLQAWCVYKSWKDTYQEHHAFSVKTLDLGDKPYDGPKQERTGAPPIPR